MSRLAMPKDDFLTPADLEQVIAICDRFEEAWKQGRTHQIEDLQSEVPAHLRPRLICELLTLKLELSQVLDKPSGQKQTQNRASIQTGSISAGTAIERDVDSNPPQLPVPAGRLVDDCCQITVSGSGPPADNAETASVVQTGAPVPTGSSSWAGVAGYENLEEIGRGGMGVVYKARHRGLGRLVALKLIRDGAHAHPAMLARLRTEAEAIARLRHENIVQVYDVGEMNGDPFIALELLEGGTLAARLASTPQPDRLAAEMSCTLARAIHTAHLVGVVHRDLKPLNVLLDESGRLKIADFGLAKRLEVESGQTQSGQVIGTPSYMAPEQARGQAHAVGPAADVYALGAILYEMLTGRPPFKGPTPLETVRQVIDDEPVPPSRLQTRVSRDLETICLKCLAKEPNRRYPSAADLADDLDRYLGGQPIRARRTPAWEMCDKWVRRHPTTTVLATLVLAASMALAATGIWYQKHLRRREKDDSARLAVRLSEGTNKLINAQAQLAGGRPDEAKLILSNLRTEIQDEPLRLADLWGRVTALLTQADAAIDRDKADAATRTAGERARQRYHRFLQEKDRAFYHETQFAGLDPTTSRGATRAAAAAALAVFAATQADHSWSLGTLPDSLSGAEQRDIEEGCYVLLLILAGAEDRPERGMSWLASARKLHSPTWAFLQRLADCLARAGDEGAAEKARREAERLTPVTAFDHFLDGLERYGRREWAAALRHFDAALRLQPDNFWANTLSAVCCLQPEVKRAEQAKVHLTASIHREPDFAWLYVLRGFASYQAAAIARGAMMDRSSAAETAQPEREARLALAEGDYRTAETLLAKTPSSELHYVLLVNRGLLRLEWLEWSRAVEDLESAIRLDGRHYLAYANLAQLYLLWNKPEEAVEQFGRAIAVRPDVAALYRGRAQVELNRKAPTREQRARALQDVDRAIGLETPGNPLLAQDQTNRALLFSQDRRDEEALAACDAALTLAPDHAETHLLRARALLRLKRYADALRSCDALLSRGKPSVEVYELRRLAREGVDDFAGAIEDLTQILSLRPDQAALLARRGDLYLIKNSPLLALRDFEKAVQLDPSHAAALAGRGTARVRLGQYREAVADAEAAVDRGPTDHRVLYKAARIYALASVAASPNVRRTGRDGVVVVWRYQDRAVSLVFAAQARIPAAEWPTFRAVLRSDPALSVIRRRLPVSRATSVDAGAPESGHQAGETQQSQER